MLIQRNRHTTTAVTAAENVGRQERYKEFAAKDLPLRKRWIATIDGRTRHAHAMANGQTVGLKEPFNIDGYDIMYPGDKSAPGYLVYNCRCTTRTVEKDGIEAEPRERRIKNADGTYSIVKDMTYRQWYEQQKSSKNADKVADVDLQSTFGKIIDNQKAIDKQYAIAIKEVFNNGTETAKKVFTKYVKSDSVASTASYGSFFDRGVKKIYLNALLDISDGRGVGVAYFHEHGHYIDFFAAGANNNNFVSMLNADFTQKLKTDYAAYLKKIIDKNAVSKEKAEILLSKELQDKKKHGVSDIIDGLTNGQVRGCASHTLLTPDYWKDTGKIEKEAFANMYQSCFDKETAKYISQYFPTAYKEFKKILKGLV